jgi:hypothetical protein
MSPPACRLTAPPPPDGPAALIEPVSVRFPLATIETTPSWA